MDYLINDVRTVGSPLKEDYQVRFLHWSELVLIADFKLNSN